MSSGGLLAGYESDAEQDLLKERASEQALNFKSFKVLYLYVIYNYYIIYIYIV